MKTQKNFTKISTSDPDHGGIALNIAGPWIIRGRGVESSWFQALNPNVKFRTTKAPSKFTLLRMLIQILQMIRTNNIHGEAY